jgi:hypothetical protein
VIDIRLGVEPGFRSGQAAGRQRAAVTLAMISTHAGWIYADLTAESPATGFLAKADLSAIAIRRILGAD